MLNFHLNWALTTVMMRTVGRVTEMGSFLLIFDRSHPAIWQKKGNDPKDGLSRFQSLK